MSDPRDDRDGVELHGSFNVKQFAEMLGLDPSDTTRLANFIRKHKSGQRPSYQEVGAAAKAFIGLVDAPQDITNRAAVMLRRVDAEKYHQKQQESVVEGIRMAKEGIEECWNDMEGQAMTQDNAGEQMSVTISMPGKNISVTTDSADEIGSILRLAGINVGGVASGDVDGDGDHDMADHNAEAPTDEPAVLYVGAGDAQPAMPSEVPGDVDGDGDHDMADHNAEAPTGEPAVLYVGAGDAQPAMPSEVPGDVDSDGDHDMADHKAEMSDDEEPKESAKPDFNDVDNDGNEKESWEDAEEDKDEAKNESIRILALAGLDESKLMNSPAGTSMDEPKVFDSLPSEKGTGSGKPDYGTRQSNMGGENPMALHSLDMEESFQAAMGEYRKFVAENISKKK